MSTLDRLSCWPCQFGLLQWLSSEPQGSSVSTFPAQKELQACLTKSGSDTQVLTLEPKSSCVHDKHPTFEKIFFNILNVHFISLEKIFENYRNTSFSLLPLSAKMHIYLINGIKNVGDRHQ